MSRPERINLHEVLKRRPYDFGVVTTYTFEPVFFERYCLVKVAALSENANLTVLTDRSVYEQLLLGEEDERPKWGLPDTSGAVPVTANE